MSEAEDKRNENRACCAHMIVRYETSRHLDGTTYGWWECRSACGMKFTPLTAALVQMEKEWKEQKDTIARLQRELDTLKKEVADRL